MHTIFSSSLLKSYQLFTDRGSIVINTYLKLKTLNLISEVALLK